MLDDDHSMDSPLNKFKIGQLVNARVVAKVKSGKSGKGYQCELSLRPSVLTGMLFLGAFFHWDYFCCSYLLIFIFPCSNFFICSY